MRFLFVYGARKPFVMRSVGEMDVEGVGKGPGYALIGECYVHGVMDGELVNDSEKMEQEIYLI